jgi:hypothetical protein
MISFYRAVKILLTGLIALVWLGNGLFCKVLNMVPRHQLIVARILGDDHALLFTRIIGMSEIAMVVWIVRGIKSRWCAIFQMTIIATMNVIEFIVAPDLLLFGRFNILFASLFIIIIYINEFIVSKHVVLDAETKSI